MSVEMIKKEVEVPKESSQIVDLLLRIASDIKEKKTLAQIISGAVEKAEDAFKGADALKSELKNPAIFLLGAIAVAQVVSLYMKKSEVAGEAVAALAAGTTEAAAPSAAGQPDGTVKV